LAWIGYGSGTDLTAVLPPERLQPIEPLFGHARRDGIAATVVSAAEHLGSGLSRAAFRGAAWDPIPAFEDLGSRTRHVSDALQRADRALVYTYDPRLDYAAHRSGMGSPAWRTALQTTDELVRALLEALPTGAALLVTGDHGGLNVPEAERVDLAERRDLADGVAWLSGDPRARHVHAEPERAMEVLDAWRSGLTDGWAVLARDEAVDGGLFGPDVRAEVRDRIGDVVAIATGAGGLFDRRRFPWETRLIGFHGALTPAELRVPLLVAIR
jgi:hypothetical protein